MKANHAAVEVSGGPRGPQVRAHVGGVRAGVGSGPDQRASPSPGASSSGPELVRAAGRRARRVGEGRGRMRVRMGVGVGVWRVWAARAERRAVRGRLGPSVVMGAQVSLVRMRRFARLQVRQWLQHRWYATARHVHGRAGGRVDVAGRVMRVRGRGGGQSQTGVHHEHTKTELFVD